MIADPQEWLLPLLRGTPLQCTQDAVSQAHAVQTASVVCALDGLALLRVSGEDAETFLQGQLSNDVRELDGSHAQFSSYSTAKGRVLTIFLLWRSSDDFFLLLSADIAAAICKRLSMYIMRSKVRIEPVTDLSLTGVHGPDAEAWLSAHAGLLPAAALALGCDDDGVMALRLPAGSIVLLSPVAAAEKLAEGAGSTLQPVGFSAWSLLDIDAGIPWITLPTQEQFVAQMLNMDIVGGLSFTKGCYPGQEIIARTRYLGKVKRRLYRVQLPHAVEIGAPLYSPETAEQTIGMVVNMAQDESGQFRALVVVQSAAWGEGVYLETGFERKLLNLSLPYPLGDE